MKCLLNGLSSTMHCWMNLSGFCTASAKLQTKESPNRGFSWLAVHGNTPTHYNNKNHETTLRLSHAGKLMVSDGQALASGTSSGDEKLQASVQFQILWLFPAHKDNVVTVYIKWKIYFSGYSNCWKYISIFKTVWNTVEAISYSIKGLLPLGTDGPNAMKKEDKPFKEKIIRPI